MNTHSGHFFGSDRSRESLCPSVRQALAVKIGTILEPGLPVPGVMAAD